MPTFTIITSTYNAASPLPRLLDSLVSQTCQDFNWIVQDGASSDNTMEIIEFYRNRLPAVYSWSENDTGIYDAWNKAINHYRDKLGKWVLFLGADDYLRSSNALEKISSELCGLPNTLRFFAASLDIVTSDGKFIEQLKPAHLPLERLHMKCHYLIHLYSIVLPFLMIKNLIPLSVSLGIMTFYVVIYGERTVVFHQRLFHVWQREESVLPSKPF